MTGMISPDPQVFTPCMDCECRSECILAGECLEPADFSVGVEQDPRWDNE